MATGADPGETREQSQVRRSRPRGGCKLVVIDDAAVNVIALPATGELVIGREESCGLRLADESVSRRHARVVVTDGRAEVEDFGSRNGTALNGQRLEGRRPLEVGDVLTLGGATILLQREEAALQRRALLADAFRARVAEEVDRALRYDRSFALFALSSPELPVESVVERLRSVDVAGVVDGVVWVLLPEIDPGEPRAVAEMMSQLATVAPAAAAGYALCPSDGCDVASLFAAVRDALRAAGPKRLHAAVETVATHAVGDREALVADPIMHRIYALIRRVAQSELPVLFTGESGTGKDVAANAVHEWSPRRGQRLIVLNCAALPEQLIESQLFGHDKGAFSGATQAKSGVFEAAQGGTVFLDEVGELTASAQAKLLRVLEAKKVTRLGETRERAVDIRILAATNRNLEADVQSGAFRRDLYYRLSAAKIMLPPLRERPRELTVLARRFMEDACKRLGMPPKRWSPGALGLLAAYAWPGNLRELKNLAEYLAAVVLGDEIAAEDLPNEFHGGGGREFAPEEPSPETAGAPPNPTLPAFGSLQEELAELERRRIFEALAATGGHQKRAAELIGMPLRTFVFKLRRLQKTDDGDA
jgi:DNA-binding NtrC family response regulator